MHLAIDGVGGRFVFFFMMFAALSGQQANGQSVTQAVPGTPSAAMVEAISNKSRAKSPPHFIQEPGDVRPTAAAEAGEFGELVLSGIVGIDGRLHEAKITQSSRSAILDAAALAAVPTMLFEPAKDADGKPLSIPANLPLEYLATDFHGPRGLAHYQCAQFVRDYDWWYKTWPLEKQDRVYKTLRGYAALNDLRTGKSGDFSSEWKDAIERCRKAPDRLMLDMLKPHGDLLRGMARP